MQLQGQLQQQQQLQLQQAIAPHPAAGGAVVRTDRPRLPSPACYGGRAAALDDWLIAMQKQFAWYNTQAEAERLRFASAFLDGAAYDWWSHLPSAEATAIDTWVKLCDALRRRFQPITTAAMARARLDTLVQGKATVHEYVSTFRRLLVPLSDMGEADRLHAFIRGLQPSIATQLRVQGVKTVDLAIEMAVRVGSMGEFAALASAATHTHSSSSAPMELDALLGIEGLEQDTDSRSSSSAAAPVADAPVTRSEFQQLLNAMREQRAGAGRRFNRGGEGAAPAAGARRDEAGRVQFNNLTREQMDKHFAEGTCFSCGKTGHQSRTCRSRQGK